MAFDPWSQDKKTIISVIIAILILSLIGGIIGFSIYHFNYRETCVPQEEFNECTNTLNLTNTQLINKEDENILLKSEIKELNNSSSQCSEDLKQCRGDFAKLNESYNNLLEKFNQLNESCQKIPLEKQDCPKQEEINGTLKSDSEKPDRGTHFEYSFIALILVLSISLPIKIGLKDDLANRVMNFFVGTFMASMLVFGYIPKFSFLTKIISAVVISIIIAVIIYKNSKN
jgi:hypothetical protein